MSTASAILMTGLPGNGKTLHTICMVKQMAEKEKRPVFYSGIEILDKDVLPWQEIDPKKWFDAPPNSIVVIDECWKTFPIRVNGSAVPPHVEQFATVRHGGLILILICQHPSQIDLFIRRLVGRHIHHVRRMGLQACKLREWPRVIDNCDKTEKDALCSEWSYDKRAYAWYKSAEVHTFKAKLPLKLLWLVIAPLAVLVAIWVVYSLYEKQHSGELIKQAAGVSTAASSPGLAAPVVQAGPSGRSGPVMTPLQYVEQFKPRIDGLAYTAPAYDEVTKPVRAPYPAACYDMPTKGCRCFTQQGTRLEVPKDLCQGIVAGGFFIAWDETRGQQRLEVNKPSPLQPVAKTEPLAGLINATPGYTPANSRPLAEQVADGENLRHGRNNRIPGRPG